MEAERKRMMGEQMSNEPSLHSPQLGNGHRKKRICDVGIEKYLVSIYN